ncbi:patatin-like phospholipase family protein [Pseudonocardia abyssalis]|uniref:Patatin-like phospholipase family protein n=1 Tax=Pseudonocardia abyssalis TaxID=2792008 RepID=A0ABS6UKZ3_9PSEU|nr:patatin-like phospholipase family protein [Pseudonocardia abyssalis]MBW0117242.1 patatin-like phospholipase family protein [Pseudonocardia abyssalis]MBW0132897.1 patatin-like phospholipase family protein [Pseudonocardia abyssalis]
MSERVGLVLSGAAARGPYQAGALAVLLPALAEQGRRPGVLLGTSSGGITAALVAQCADLPPGDAGRLVEETWIGFGDVFRNPLCTPGPAAAVAARLAGLGMIGAPDALLDVTPLRSRAGELFRPDRVAANIASGAVESVAVAATVCPPARSAARSRLFVQGARPSPAHAVDVVPVALRLDHLLASAAIPGMFPPVLIDESTVGAGWYVDGGVRLNAPLRPAVDLGVDRLVVISGHSVDPPPVPPLTPPYHAPDLASTAAMSVRAILADGLADDVATLRSKNRRPEHRVVPHLVVAPEDGELAAIAAESFAPTGPWDPYWAIGRLLDSLGAGSGRDELLSLVLFREAYAEGLAERGRRDAARALDAGWVV